MMVDETLQQDGTAVKCEENLRLADSLLMARRDCLLDHLSVLEVKVNVIASHLPSSEVEFKELPSIVDGFFRYRYIQIFGKIANIADRFLILSGLNVPSRAKGRRIFWTLEKMGVLDTSSAHLLCNTLRKKRQNLVSGGLGPNSHFFVALELLIDTADDFIDQLRNALVDISLLEMWDRFEVADYRMRNVNFVPRCGILEAVKQTGYWAGRLFFVCPDCKRRCCELFRFHVGVGLWKCRKCLGLVYRSSYQNRYQPKTPRGVNYGRHGR